MKKQSNGTTPFPNVLLDEVMPTLRDTEWRILCLVVRSTLGWHQAPGVRKERDWLSNWQLVKRSGRSSASVSRAVKHLSALGLIVVTDEQGRSLSSAALRRGSFGKLYFALAQRSKTEPFVELRSAKLQTTKAKETKEKLINRKEGDAAVRIGGWHRVGHLITKNQLEGGAE